MQLSKKYPLKVVLEKKVVLFSYIQSSKSKILRMAGFERKKINKAFQNNQQKLI